MDEGMLRAIGLQDASVKQLTEVMGSARIAPAVNSVEVHPGNRNDELLAFCRCQVRRLDWFFMPTPQTMTCMHHIESAISQGC